MFSKISLSLIRYRIYACSETVVSMPVTYLDKKARNGKFCISDKTESSSDFHQTGPKRRLTRMTRSKEEKFTPKSRADWRIWLSNYSTVKSHVWIVRHKKGSGRQALSYDDSVEEALCFGWIDTTVRSLDAEKFMQKFTPRRPRSNWSATNKARVGKLISQGLMQPQGQQVIDAAKADGSWSTKPAHEVQYEMPTELSAALAKNKQAELFFETLTKSQRRQMITFVASAKKDETKVRRATKVVLSLQQEKYMF